MKEHELDCLFDAARAAQPVVPPALAERVLEDAKRAAPAKGFSWRDWVVALGGKRGLGGLVMATCVGFWIGVAPPQALPDLAGLVLGQELLDTTDSASGLYGWDIEEG